MVGLQLDGSMLLESAKFSLLRKMVGLQHK